MTIKSNFTLDEAFKALNSKPKKVVRESFDYDDESYDYVIEKILDSNLTVGDTLYLGITHENNGTWGNDGETNVSFLKTRTGFIVNLYEFNTHDIPEEVEEADDIDFFSYAEASIKRGFDKWIRKGKPAFAKVHCENSDCKEDLSVDIPLNVIKDKKFKNSYDALNNLNLFEENDMCSIEAEINGKRIDLDDYDLN